MKNKYVKITFILLIIIITFSTINIIEYKIYTKNYNDKINEIINKIETEYPLITTNEIIEILTSKNNQKIDTLSKYGIFSTDSAILKNDEANFNFLILNIIFLILSFILLILIFIKYNKKKDKEIKEITSYIKEINKGNYSLKINEVNETELSKLKSEIYKTTIKLKEASVNSNIDKINLKNSLEDISHQLKTPLTSILIMLDNLIDDINMEKEIRQEFLIDIKRDIVNMNYFINTLLKLSKFDSNTIKFKKEKISIKYIIDESVKNVLPLSDLKNVNVKVDIKDNTNIICDKKWQIEAITNILKNSIEYSYLNKEVNILCTDNDLYTLIIIENYGNTINSSDIKHIFERFYEGENSTSSSLGIGLSLSKSIIESNNGQISVKSKDNKTSFLVKYFK